MLHTVQRYLIRTCTINRTVNPTHRLNSSGRRLTCDVVSDLTGGEEEVTGSDTGSLLFSSYGEEGEGNYYTFKDPYRN